MTEPRTKHRPDPDAYDYEFIGLHLHRRRDDSGLAIVKTQVLSPEGEFQTEEVGGPTLVALDEAWRLVREQLVALVGEGIE